MSPLVLLLFMAMASPGSPLKQPGHPTPTSEQPPLATIKTPVEYTVVTMPPLSANDPWNAVTSFYGVAKKLQDITSSQELKTVNALLAAFERILTLASQKHSLPDTTTALAIVKTTAELLNNMTAEPHATQAQSPRFVVQVVRHPTLVIDRSPLEIFHGENVYQSASFQVSTMCIVSDIQHAAVIVYPPDTSLLRPPPTQKHGKVVAFRAVDLVLMPRSAAADLESRREQACPKSVYFDMLLLGYTANNDVPNARYACAAWNGSQWRTDDCFVSRDLSRTRSATCYCDTKNAARSSAYVIYVYIDDVASGLRFVPTNSSLVRAPSDVTGFGACVDQIERLVEKDWEQGSFDTLIASPLTSLTLPRNDSTLWPTPGEVERILNAVGAILCKVQPKNDVIGWGTALLTGVVFRMETYRYPPITAYSFYKDPAPWMEYTRSRDVIDWDVTFHERYGFVVMLSDTVVQQNVRYGFVLYPQDRYLAPIEVIDGHPVVASRVLDLALVKLRDLQDRKDQFVHLYFNPTLGTPATALRRGCAYWSRLNATWVTKYCHMDPAVYRHVCTCNLTAGFNESREHAQLVGFVFDDLGGAMSVVNDVGVARAGANEVGRASRGVVDDPGVEFVSLSLFALQELRKYQEGPRTVEKELDLLGHVFVRPNGSLKINDEVKMRFISEARDLLTNNTCKPYKMAVYADAFGVLCFDSTHHDAEDPVVSIAFSRGVAVNVVTQRASTADVDVKVNDDTAFAVRVSDSVATNNKRYAILVYPTDICLRAPPTMNQPILGLRVVDFVLVPDPTAVEAEQTFAMYLDQSALNATQSCAYWSDDWQAWTEIGCLPISVQGRTVCNCSLTMHFAERRNGSQYVVFTYSDVYFDEEAFRTFTASDGVELEAARQLVYNASLLPADDELVCKVLQVYNGVVSLDRHVLASNFPAIKAIIGDLGRLLARYHSDTRRPVERLFSVPRHSGAVELKDGVGFSDALGEDVATVLLLAAVGFYKGDVTDRPAGVYGRRGQASLAHGDPTAILPTRPSFACLLPSDVTARYYRLVFVVYPLNASPLPLTMTTASVFNLLQVEVHVDIANPYSSTLPLPRPKTAPLDIYFRPSDAPASYTRLGCVSWNDAADAWTDALCTINASTPDNAFCRCDVGQQSVTRVIVFELADVATLSFKTGLEAKSIVFVVLATLSLLGLLGIAVTAVKFPAWRLTVVNKTLLALAASTGVYLVLGMYRETHHTFTTLNLSNASLVGFIAILHVARLSHYAWALCVILMHIVPPSRHLLIKMAVVALCVSLTPVVVLLAVDADTHFAASSTLAACVLHVAPGVVVVLVSVASVGALCGRKGKGGGEGKKGLGVVSGLGVLFGVPALIEVFNVAWVQNEGADFVYKVLDPVQGLGLFLLFVVFDAHVRAWVLGKDREDSEVQGTQIEMTSLRAKVEQ